LGANRTRADELRELGYAAFRAGKIERAHKLFERALELGGTDATILSDLGVAASALGRDAIARSYHEKALKRRRETLGAAHQDVAASLHNLAVVCRNLGDLETAAACHEEGLKIWRATLGAGHPAVARALFGLGAIAARRGDAQAALAHHLAALRIRQACVPAPAGDIAASLDAIGAIHAGLGNHEAAVSHFTAAVEKAPDLLTARHHLAVSLTRLGRHADAAPHRDAALRRQSVFVQEGPANAPRVLILAGSDVGNVPLEHLLPEGFFARIWWFVAHAGRDAAASLPPYDVVFNGIGDADMAGPGERVVAAFLKTCRKPVLNHPARVRETARDRLPAALAGLDLIIPRVVRVGAAGDVSALRPPLLLRPPGAHGGAGVLRIDDWAALTGDVAAGWYAIEYIDCAGADGFTRKYRIAFVGGVPYPYHLAISPHWMVHYRSADMPAHAWKLAEEAAFLADWRSALGPAAANAIAPVGRRLGLDFCGIDFGMAPDGRAVLFEANATMLIHPEAADGPLAFKNQAVRRILDAMQALITAAAQS
jgi:tetratricopeptide (TPR) repeat protein